MKVLLNATTLVVGGGIQIGVSFIQQVINDNRFSWKFLVSKGIYNTLSPEIRADERIICFEVSPAQLISGKDSRKQIKKIESEFQPDIVYSIGFPSYIKFKTKEIGRYTNPWEINPEPLPWHTIKGKLNVIKTKLGIYYRSFWAGKADYIETQTEAAKKGIITRIGFPEKRIKVFPNSPNRIFVERGKSIENLDKTFDGENIAFCLSAPYRHKNLDIVPYVAKNLRDKYKLDVKFILTIPQDGMLSKEIEETSKKLNVEDLIENVGVLKLNDCLSYYEKAKIVFLPTLLEIFSATFLEAMAMKRPIVTTDLDFSLDNCKEAAVYFKAGNAESASDKIFELLHDRQYFINQIKRGEKVLGNYPDNPTKYNELLNWFKLIINGEQ